MNRIAFTGDWHIPPATGGGARSGNGLSRRFESAVRTIHAMMVDIAASKPDALVFLGDIWAPVGNVADADQVVAAQEAFNKAYYAGIPLYLLPGNHDGCRDMVAADALAPFAEVGRVLNGYGITGEGLNLAWCQYMSPDLLRSRYGAGAEATVQECRAHLSKLLWGLATQPTNEYPTVLVMHQALQEARLSTAHPSQTMAGREFGLSLVELPPVTAVVSGHVHLAQVVNQAPLVCYAGSPYRVDFGEAEDPKSWGMLTIDEEGRPSWETFPTACPEMVKLVWSLAQARTATASDAAVPEGAIVRVTLTGEHGEGWIDARQHVVDVVTEAGASEVAVVADLSRPENIHASGARAERGPWENVQAVAGELGLVLGPRHQERFLQAMAAGIASGRSLTGVALRPERLQLTGFGPCWGAVDLDLGALSSCVVTGVNGAGKSSLLVDAPMWCLAGAVLRGRQDNHASLLANGNDAVAAAMEFSVGGNGDRYRIARRYERRGKSSGHTLTLEHGNGGGLWENLSAATLDATQSRVFELLGLDGADPVGLIQRTALIPQGDSGGFAAAKPVERKALLGELLGLGAWAQTCQTLRGWRTEGATAIAAAQAKWDAASVTGSPERVAAALQAAEDAQSELDAADAALGEALAAVDAAREEAATHQTALAVLEEKATRATEVAAELDRLGRGLEVAQSDSGESEEDLRQELAEHQEALDELTAHAARIEAARAVYDERIRDLERAEFAFKEAESADLARVSAAGMALAAKQRSTLEAKTALDGANREWSRWIAAAEQAVTDAVRQRDAALATLALRQEQATEACELLQRVPCGDDLQAECPLLENARAVAGTVAALALEETAIRAACDEHGLRQAVEAARVEPAGVTAARAVVSTAETEEQAAEAALIAARVPSEETTARAQGVKDAHQAVEEALPACERGTGDNVIWERGQEREIVANRQQRLDELAQSKALARAEAAQIQSQMDTLLAEQARLAGDLEGLAAARTRSLELSAAVGRLANDAQNAQTATDTARASVARTSNTLEVCQDSARLAATAAEELAQLREEDRVLADLALLTGPSGVVPRLLDEAVPAAEEAANEVLAIISDGAMALRFESRTIGSGGNIRETLDIHVDGLRGQQEYEKLSGGERVRVDLAIVVGLSRLLASRAGSHLQWCVLDEMCAPLDAQGRGQFVEAVKRLRDVYPLVFVISHLDEVAAMFEQRIEVVRGAETSTLHVHA